jgi:hypothetical protein
VVRAKQPRAQVARDFSPAKQNAKAEGDASSGFAFCLTLQLGSEDGDSTVNQKTAKMLKRWAITSGKTTRDVKRWWLSLNRFEREAEARKIRTKAE